MSIRLIAQELYRLHREVEGLEKKLASAKGGEREAIAEQLRRVTAERNYMRRILEAKKDVSPT